MKMRCVSVVGVLGIVLLFGTVAFAQDYARVEVHANYSYMRFNPENSNIVSSFSTNVVRSCSGLLSSNRTTGTSP